MWRVKCWNVTIVLGTRVGLFVFACTEFDFHLCRTMFESEPTTQTCHLTFTFPPSYKFFTILLTTSNL